MYLTINCLLFFIGGSFLSIRNEKFYWSMVLVLAVIVVSWPWLTVQTLTGDDMLYHLNRIEGIKEGLLAGQFPVRIHAFQLSGYGAPDGIFYPDVLLYFPALLRILGVPLGIANNTFCVMMNLLTAFLAWYAFSLMGKSIRVGAVASLLYLSSWYHLMNLYVRYDVGEIAAMAFFPLALAGLLCILRDNVRRWPLFVIGSLGIFQAHIWSSIFWAACVVLILVFYWRRFYEAERRWAVVKSLGIIFLLHLWFVVPFLSFYMGMDFNKAHSFSTIAGSGFDVCDFLPDQFMCGWPIFFFCGLFLVQGLFKKDSDDAWHSGCVMLLVGVILTWLATNAFPWSRLEKIPALLHFTAMLQYPRRFLELSSVLLPFVAALGFYRLAEHRKWKARCLAAGCVLFCVWNIFAMMQLPIFLNGKVYPAREYKMYTAENIPSFAPLLGDDYLYKGMEFQKLKNREGQPRSGKEIYSEAELDQVRKVGTTFEARYVTDRPAILEVPLIYYPGYKAIDGFGNDLTIKETQDHIIQVELPPGSTSVRVYYRGLTRARIADLVSLLAAVAFGVYLYRNRRICF